MIARKLEKFILNEDAHVSVILKDLDKSELIYTYNESIQVPSASTIKIVIMIEAINQTMKGKFSFHDLIDIRNEDRVEYSIVTELEINRFTFKDLITLMITVSDNTATNILIDLLGIENINRLARDLNLKDTLLQRRMMDFQEAKLGKENYTSPYDMAKTLELIYNKEILNGNMCRLMIDILKKQKDKGMLSRYLPSGIEIAHKTGELENLNHDIGIIFLEERDYILGVFVTEAKSNLRAKKTIGHVSKMVYEDFKNQGVKKR
ncbi:MAG: class A beta-lactamase-related serine hydrolase [Clostridia bacterium]|nr:class A beta-lactamase-related serine hydrolase [Clostridia bacterium]